MDKKIILFELNEVPWRIIDQYCQWYPRSTFARRLPEFRQYETYSEDVGSLSPWITWPTVHRGVNDAKHFIANFGQDLSEVDREFPPVWQILADHGVSTGVCGSLHSYPMPKNLANYAFYLPDTFAAGSECFPNSLSVYQEFNLSMARESARNVSSKVPWKSAMSMLAKSPELGLRFRTFLDIGKQLVNERIRSWQKTRRRTYQVVLAFDVFMKQLAQTRPAFSSFFTNHVASSMHRYWAAAFPSDYQEFNYDQEWVHTFGDEIKFTMNKFDAFVARLLRFVDDNPEYVLWIATSMGQAATEALPFETQLYIVDEARFMTAMGLESRDWSKLPAMLPSFNYRIVDEKITQFREHLDSTQIYDRKLRYKELEGGFFTVELGQTNCHLNPPVAQIGGRNVSFDEMGLKNVEIEDKSGTSAYHIPQGSLLVYDPLSRPTSHERTQVSTLELLPTILKNFSVPIPEYMARSVTI